MLEENEKALRSACTAVVVVVEVVVVVVVLADQHSILEPTE